MSESCLIESGGEWGGGGEDNQSSDKTLERSTDLAVIRGIKHLSHLSLHHNFHIGSDYVFDWFDSMVTVPI